MFGLYLMYTVLVFLLGTALVLQPVAAEGGEARVARRDSRVLFRISAVVIILASLVATGLIAAYFADPKEFRGWVSQPLRTILANYHWVMFAGVVMYVIARLCGIKHRYSLWLFCLSLPGALTMPVMVFAALVSGAGDFLNVSSEFLIHPATWILPIIAVRQWLWLQSSKDIHVWSGIAQTCVILVAYVFSELLAYVFSDVPF